MQNILRGALIAGLTCLVAGAQRAEAGATIDLIWRGDGDSTLSVTPGAESSTVTLDIFLKADEPIFLVSVSLEFDGDGGNELNALSVFNWGGTTFGPGALFGPLGVLQIKTESGSGGPTGEIQSFSTAVLSFPEDPIPAPAGTYHIGTAVWHVTSNVATDGPDIVSGLFNTGVDFVSDGAAENIKHKTLFGTASVILPPTAVPVPLAFQFVTAALIGLVGFAQLRSRKR